tara:strand:- start:797 stop:2800 length:2004 start_codon:yes stop_codon:yes gene_type:complete
MANTSKGRFPSYGLVRGPSHADGGVPASVADGPDVELEGGEYIIPKEAVPDYLPVLQQITQIGRDRQKMQNGNTAIDALIASASMQNGIAQPKSPVYQEGGQVQSKTLRGSRVVSRDIGRDGDMFTGQVIMAIPADQVGGDDGLRYYLSEPRQSQSMSLLDRKAQSSARRKMAFAPQDSLPADLVEGYFDRQNKTSILNMDNEKSPLGFLKNLIGKQQGGMIQYEDGGELDIRRSSMPIQSPKMLGEDSIDSILSIINQGKRNGVNVTDTPEYKRYNKSYNLLTKNTKKGVPPAEGEIDRVTNDYLVDISTKAYLINELIKSGQYDNIGQIKNDFINLDLKDTMPKMEDGGEVHSRRMFNQGTGFDKKKSDLNKDGKISEYERKRGMAIAKAMGKMQMGGMVDKQPMMQRPMNPAMNFSPMQRMNPRMYQDGGQVQPRKQQEMRNPNMFIGPPMSLMGPGLSNFEKAEKEFEAFMDSLNRRQNINPFTGEPMDTDADVKKLLERMKKSKIPRSRQRVPMQTGGQVKASDMGLQNFGEVTDIPSGSVSRPEFEAFMNYAATEEEAAEMEREQMANFMSLLENEKRVRPVSPDTYNTTIAEEDGMMIMSKREVPKLSEAYMSAFGFATPLSKRQGALLQRKMIAPETLNPSVKGLINRVLVQRLGNENN